MRASIFKPLRIKAYRSLFGAQLFSNLGNWIDFVALQVIVAYHWGLGEAAIASVIIVLGLPWVLIGPFASVFIDRLPKKKVMIVCSILKISFVAGLFYSPNLFILLIFIFLKATVASLYDPARQSAIRMTVPVDQLPEAVTLSQLSVNTMKIVGPALGAGIIALFGAKSPFIFEGICFAIAILFLITLPSLDKTLSDDNTQSEVPAQIKEISYWPDLLTGIRHIRNVPLLKISIIISSIAFFIIFLYDGLFIFIAKDLGFNEGNFGLLISAVGLGSVLGSLSLGQWTNWKTKPIKVMSMASVFSGVLILSIGLGGLEVLNFAHWIWMLAALLLGILGAAEAVPYGYILQSETPEHMMAKVSSAATSLQTFSMLIAPAAGALLAKWVGVSNVLLVAGCATSLLSVSILLFISNKRQLNKPTKIEV